MTGGVFGGGVIFVVAAVLWTAVLVPAWVRRREFKAAEQNAVRLQRTLRVLAETAEVPTEVRVEATARANGFTPQWESLAELHAEDQPVPQPAMVTLQILGGRKEKIRPGDVLGALTGEAGLAADQIGKINVNEQSTYVAVARGIARQALKRLQDGKIKGKKVRVQLLDG